MEQTADAVNFLEQLKKEKRILDFAVKYTALQSDYKKLPCIHPFTTVRIYNSCNVRTCCEAFIRENIGNIKLNTIEEIWYGKKAEELRKRILRNDYSMCNLDLCDQYKGFDISMIPDKIGMPRIAALSYDRECNLHCLYCRDKQYKNSKEQTDAYNQNVYSMLKSVLKNIEEIDVSGVGEAFYSTHSRELIKKIASEYPLIHWNIKTNGVLFNTQNCKTLGIYGRINTVYFSLHAIDRKIYNTIMRGADYDIVIKNIKEAAYECNHNKKILKVLINSVISVLNYKEIPRIAEFAANNNINLIFTPFRRHGTQFGSDYKSVSVWDKEHPEFENFKKILKHPALNYEKIRMTPLFAKIKKEITH